MKSYGEMLEEARKKIPKEVTQGSRLEIPAPKVMVQGNRTFITNFTEITDSIRRSPRHLSKFLFRELAKPGHVDDNRLVLQGKVRRALIEGKIDVYVKGFVYCKECNRPDTHLVKEDRITFLKCEACGAKQVVRHI